MPTILVVDDRADVRSALAEDLQASGLEVVTARDGSEGWARFEEVHPHLVITDLRMPGADGIDLLRRVRARSPVPVIVLTAYGDVPTAVEAMRSGATDFLSYPEEADRAVERAVDLVGNRRVGDSELLLKALPGRSNAVRRLRSRVAALAPLRVPVLVRGERGSGRSQLVRAIHHLSGSDADLLTIRASDAAAGDAWSSSLDVPVYLVDVEQHPPSAQMRWASKLGEMDRASPGAGFRLFASTSEPRNGAEESRLDPGLAGGLSRFEVYLPPLRERLEDLPDLVAVMLERIGRMVERQDVRISTLAMRRLRSYSWPGNLRELESVLERLVAFSAEGVVNARAVDEILSESSESLAAARRRRDRRERAELLALLDACGGNLAEVARRLGMSRSAVHYRVRKHGLMPARRR